MSQRQLKKLRMQQELLEKAEQVEASSGRDESDSDERPAPVKARPNPFSGFAALAGAADDDDADEEEEPEEEDNEPPVTQETKAPSSSKKNRKSKKKKKGKKTIPDEEAPPKSRESIVDDIDKAIQELNLSQTHVRGEASSEQRPVNHVDDLLRINFLHLKAMNEMRKLFGKGIAEAAAEIDNPQAPADRAALRHGGVPVGLEDYLRAPPGRGLSEVQARRNPFVDGKKTWPAGASGGLTMSCCDNSNADVVEFTFAHTAAYESCEMQFYQLVQLYDPMRIVAFLHNNPYHISSLIQASKIATQDQNAALSADLCERALFTFGRVSLSSFRKKLEQGKARIDFRRPENRHFYLSGYNYIKNLIRKGTYRTALEWAKIFVSISPDDPYDMMNWIHILAIRAHEAQWFIDICDSSLLNNVQSQGNANYIRQTAVLAKLQLKDFSGAKLTVIKGMQQIPWLYCALFSALNLDAPRAVWGVQPRNEEEELYTSLYVHMAKALWDNPEAISFLEDVGGTIPKVDAKSLPPSPQVSPSTARFVYLDNTPSLMSEVPRGMLRANPNYDFDPLPPSKDENVFSHESQKEPWNDLEADHGTSRTRLPIEVPAHPLEAGGPNQRNLLARLLAELTGGRMGTSGAADDEVEDMLIDELLMPGAWPGMEDDDEHDWVGDDDDMDADDFGGYDDEDNMPDLIPASESGQEHQPGDEGDEDELPDLIPGSE